MGEPESWLISLDQIWIGVCKLEPEFKNLSPSLSTSLGGNACLVTLVKYEAGLVAVSLIYNYFTYFFRHIYIFMNWVGSVTRRGKCESAGSGLAQTVPDPCCHPWHWLLLFGCGLAFHFQTLTTLWVSGAAAKFDTLESSIRERSENFQKDFLDKRLQ